MPGLHPKKDVFFFVDDVNLGVGGRVGWRGREDTGRDTGCAGELGPAVCQVRSGADAVSPEMPKPGWPERAIWLRFGARGYRRCGGRSRAAYCVGLPL